jgi:urate oxidase
MLAGEYFWLGFLALVKVGPAGFSGFFEVEFLQLPEK